MPIAVVNHQNRAPLEAGKIDLIGQAIRIEQLTAAPCGRPQPGSPADLAALDSVSSCRLGMGGRRGCPWCEGEAVAVPRSEA